MSGSDSRLCPSEQDGQVVGVVTDTELGIGLNWMLFAVDQMAPDSADHLGLVLDEIDRGSRTQVSPDSTSGALRGRLVVVNSDLPDSGMNERDFEHRCVPNSFAVQCFSFVLVFTTVGVPDGGCAGGGPAVLPAGETSVADRGAAGGGDQQARAARSGEHSGGERGCCGARDIAAANDCAGGALACRGVWLRICCRAPRMAAEVGNGCPRMWRRSSARG